ncbi:MAG TPA: PAS domain S-box protein [Steroidobacteraceae bacterium]|jgi:PAS domain S-box-containing protein
MNEPPKRPRPESILASQWRQIVNSAIDTAIISTDTEGFVTSWNRGAELILGWAEEEVLGATLERIFTEEQRAQQQLGGEMRDALQTGRGGGEEGWRLRKDGTRFWAVGELTPIRDGNKNVLGFTKILRDRTAQRQTEQTIRDEFRAIEILNRAVSALSLENDRQRVVQIVTDTGVELSGAEFGAFFYNVTNDKGESYLLYTLSGAPAEAFSKFPMPRNTEVFGPTFSGAAIVRSGDITQDPRYGHNEPYRGMPKGHLPVKSYLAVPVVSRAGAVIGGLFFGHSERDVFTDRSEQWLVGLAAEASVAIDNTLLTQELRSLNATLEQQVTERTEQLRKKEEALRQSQKMEAVGQLTGGVAHDFNNILQVISGNLDIISRGLPANSPRLNRAAQNAMAGAKRAAALTQRLLAFSRRQPLDPKPIDVNTLVSGMSDLLHRTLGETIELETVRAGRLWSAEADANELESALLNLALNARDAMPQGGRLTIETANVDLDRAYAATQTEVIPGQYVSIAVSDTGSGMNEATVSQAFEPFFTTKPVGQGTGLGLSQVYGFVKQSGGHVRIYSEVGQGTTIKIYLPRLLRKEMPGHTPDPQITPEGSLAETILVTEDDPDVRTYSVEALQELGYRVIEAADGPSSLELLETTPHVDLLFTDVVLPGGMTGAQLAAQARGRWPDLKVLFTTGYARNAIVHHGRLDPGVQLITKPFTIAELATRVREVLETDAPRDTDSSD